jgi:hypothetical protein
LTLERAILNKGKMSRQSISTAERRHGLIAFVRSAVEDQKEKFP